MERRREPRLRVSWPVTFAAMAGAGDGIALDASLCGMRIVSQVEMMRGDLAIVHIRLDPCTEVDCAVRIARKDRRDHEVVYGSEIVYISPADRLKLSFALLMARDRAA